jgi:hypothetical protein
MTGKLTIGDLNGQSISFRDQRMAGLGVSALSEIPPLLPSGDQTCSIVGKNP